MTTDQASWDHTGKRVTFQSGSYREYSVSSLLYQDNRALAWFAETSAFQEENPKSTGFDGRICYGVTILLDLTADDGEIGVQILVECSGVHPTEIRTSISPSSAFELNTTSELANYATEAVYLITPVWDSKPDLCVIGNLVYCETDALNQECSRVTLGLSESSQVYIVVSSFRNGWYWFFCLDAVLSSPSEDS
uniref:Uncharacterized protein n=1 Tax=Timema poppense TaxID=170557 RepID=A0A7R9CR01_TIMPO|nr:unnamed protein product [Timema poppensis]